MEVYNNDEEKSAENQEILEKIAGAFGIIALSVGSGFIGYKIAEHILKDDMEIITKDYVIPKEVEFIYQELKRGTDFAKKMKMIKVMIFDRNWIYKYGAALTLFAEFEFFLVVMTRKHLGEDIKIKKNYIKKLGTLKGCNVLNAVEYDTLVKLHPVRNALAHGSYETIKDQDIEGSFTIIEQFINAHKIVTSSHQPSDETHI